MLVDYLPVPTDCNIWIRELVASDRRLQKNFQCMTDSLAHEGTDSNNINQIEAGAAKKGPSTGAVWFSKSSRNLNYRTIA